jgi:ribosomal-protein-alanine N-acetyltransferase
MTPRAMADLMAENHAGGLGWSADGIAAMLAQPGVFAVCHSEGFALVRVTGPEAEILTVEVRRAAQGRGIGTWLLSQVTARAKAASVAELHLEVARDNAAARHLYDKAGFEVVGRRPAYYRDGDGTAVDAVLMRRALDPSGAPDASGMGSS